MAGTRKPVVEVRRSERRRRTVSAYRDGERVVVLIPDRFSRAEESEWVDRMLARLASRQRHLASDEELMARARRLAARYLGEYDVAPASVRWVSNQRWRWGSCTPQDRTIRISDRVRGMPEWVIDYVILRQAGASHRPHPRHPLLGPGRPLPQGRTRPRIPGGSLRGQFPRSMTAGSGLTEFAEVTQVEVAAGERLGIGEGILGR